MTGGINIRKVKSFMVDHTNYYDNEIEDYSRARVVDMLNNNKPVYIRGAENNNDDGHAWVIDGYHKYKIDEWERTFIGTFVDEERIIATYNYDLLHCNYGWGGICDGYYTEGIFDTTHGLGANMIDTSVGDKGEAGDYDFDSEIRIIQYSK